MALTAEEYFQRGVKNIEKGFWEESLVDWTAVIQIEPEKPSAYFNRGFAKHKLGQNEAAISDLDHAIKFNPNDAEAHFLRGTIQSQLEEYVKALSDLDQAICLDPRHSQAYGSRGLVKSRLSYHKSAIDDYNQAISLDPKDAVSYYNRADAKSNLNDISGALSDCNKAIEIDPNLEIAYFNRGFIYAKLGNFSRAVLDYDCAIRLDPNYAAAYTDRGTAQFNLENYDMAIYDCSQAILINPKYAKPYFIRGISYQVNADFYEAELDINRFLYLTNNATFLKNPIPLFDFCFHNPAPYLLYHTLQKFTENFDQFNTVHPIVDATRQQCKPWKRWEEWRRLSGSEKAEPLTHHHALALVNHYMGDSIEAFRIYDEVLDDEEMMGVPLNLMGLYYYIESAKLFRQPFEVILEDAIEQIEESREELIQHKAFRELYYAGQILWANEQPVAAHEFFELADDYLPAAYMQVLSMAAVGAKIDEIENKIADIREREAALPPEEAFLRGFRARPFRLEKPGEDFLAPILQYAHYREITEAIAEIRRADEPFEHHDLWKAFYWLQEEEKELNWLIRREELAALSRELLAQFKTNVAAQFEDKDTDEEMALIEQAFNDLITKDDWEGTKYADFEDFKTKTNQSPNLKQQLARLVSDNRRLGAHNKMLLVEYCYLRGDLDIEDVFLMYFYVSKHNPAASHGNIAQEGLVDGGKKIVELLLSPVSITGQVLTAVAAAALTELLKKFSTDGQQAEEIDLGKYRQAASGTQPTEQSDYDRFVDDFLRFLSHERETLGEEKFAQRFPLEGFEDWMRKKKKD